MWTATVWTVDPVQSRDEKDCWRITTSRVPPDDDCFFLFRRDEPPAVGDTVHVGTHTVYWGDRQARKHLNDFKSDAKDSA